MGTEGDAVGCSVRPDLVRWNTLATPAQRIHTTEHRLSDDAIEDSDWQHGSWNSHHAVYIPIICLALPARARRRTMRVG